MATIRHEKFAEMAEVTEDEEYKTMFMAMAMGDFPKGFKYDKNRFTHHCGKKTVPIVLPDDPISARDKFMKFMSKKGMHTKDQLAAKKIKTVESHKKGWVAVKSVRLQQEHINAYLDKLSVEKRLTETQDMFLRRVVFMAYCCDVLTPEKVKYDHGGITNIEGLNWDDSLRCYTLSGFEYFPRLSSR
jgi:hypothetical protein